MRRLLWAACGLAALSGPAFAQQPYPNSGYDPRYVLNGKLNAQWTPKDENSPGYVRGWSYQKTLEEAERHRDDPVRRDHNLWQSGEYLPTQDFGRLENVDDYSRAGLEKPPKNEHWVFDGYSYFLVSRDTGFISYIIRPGDSKHIYRPPQTR